MGGSEYRMRERVFLIKLGDGLTRMRQRLRPFTGGRLYSIFAGFLLFSLANS